MSLFGVTFAKAYDYQFPKIKGCESFPVIVQLHKIDEELEELRAEVVDENDVMILVEAIDLIVSVETLLRAYPKDVVDAAANVVFCKNKMRGYWDLPDEEYCQDAPQGEGEDERP